jgi:hypothetical protein
MLFTEPICFKCAHFDIETSLCKAFGKEDIPFEILSGDNNHTRPLPEQKNDIVFEPIKKKKND